MQAQCINALTESFEAVEVFGIPALFTTQRVNRASIPRGMYAYDMQTSAEDWSQPCLLARQVDTAHYGTVLTASPIFLSKQGYRNMTPSDFQQGDGLEPLTVTEFEQQFLAVEEACSKPAPLHQGKPLHRVPLAR